MKMEDILATIHLLIILFNVYQILIQKKLDYMVVNLLNILKIHINMNAYDANIILMNILLLLLLINHV